MYKKLLSIGLATSILLAGCGSDNNSEVKESNTEKKSVTEKLSESEPKEIEDTNKTISEMTMDEIKDIKTLADYKKVTESITDFSKKTVVRVQDKNSFIAAQEEHLIGGSDVKNKVEEDFKTIETSHKIILNILSSRETIDEELSYANRYEVRENLEKIERIYNQNK